MDFLERMAHSASTMLHDLLAWVEGLAATPWGGWALFGIAFAESSFFPVPPDVLLIALCLGSPELSLWFAAVCSVGSVLGGMFGYGLGYYGGRPLLRRLFAAERIQTVERLFDRWNAWAVGVAGLTPLPYKIFTVSGGAFAINFKVFVIASVLSRSLRFFVVAAAIQLWGEPVREFIHRYLNVLSIAFVVLLAGGFWLTKHGFGRASRQPAEGAAPAIDPGDG